MNTGVETALCPVDCGGSHVQVSYYRAKLYVYSAASDMLVTWFLLKVDDYNSLPNLSDADVLEKYQKEGWILKRGCFLQRAGSMDLVPSVIAVKVFNVDLDDKDMCVVVINRSANAGDVIVAGEREQRTIQIGGA